MGLRHPNLKHILHVVVFDFGMTGQWELCGAVFHITVLLAHCQAVLIQEHTCS